MQFEEQAVTLERIDRTDDTFRITTRQDFQDLTGSIRRFGLLNPPILMKSEAGFAIVAGFRRIAACTFLKKTTIRSRIVSEQTTLAECALIAVASNALERSLNLLEQARALNMLWQYPSDDTAPNQLAGLFGLPQNPSLIDKIRTLTELPPAIQKGVLSEVLSLPMALELGRLKNETGVWMAALFSELKLSLNKQREIVTLVQEVAQREGVSRQAVLAAQPIQDIRSDPEMDRTQKTRRLRAYLRGRRFPHLSATEKKFKRHLKKLGLGQEIDLRAPRDFEGQAYTLTLPLTRLEDLKKLQAILTRIGEHPSLQAILDKKF